MSCGALQWKINGGGRTVRPRDTASHQCQGSGIQKEDGWLYAIYGTPAESLCGLQVEQFRKKYGIIENVSDRPYVSNSFHCHVTEDLTPIEKQGSRGTFLGQLQRRQDQYVRYPIDYSVEAIRSLIRRAMALGFYGGSISLICILLTTCGHQELEMDVCLKVRLE